MSVLLGYDFWADTVFSDDSTSISSIVYIETSNSIIDEISVRESTSQGTSNIKDVWNSDTKILGKFLNSLEAGNIGNFGIPIVKFRILRRLDTQNQVNDIQLGEVNFVKDAQGNADLSFVDVTNPNSKLTYSIIPVGENGIDGSPREISVLSNFSGVWIVNKDTKEVLVFDKAFSSMGNIDSTHTQNRTQIDTFSKYPQFYYGSQAFEAFTLSTVVLPDNGERSGIKYKEILDKFILDHTPKIVKTDTGKILVADISNMRASTPLVTWDGYDFTTISVDLTECYDYEKFMKGE